ncbi:MAG: type II toxin-antitoxin system Phd/YefM family antitoxin [Oscillospiraceae bacterium]|nr:type II toxin-antitoxin system Phd/YefM family antitoxin [Oscillospiraceae bacterium]
MQSLAESIRPSADLRNRYGEISRLCREQREAVIITVNGRGDTVSLGYEQYQQLKAKVELLELLGKAEDDVRNGRVAPMQSSFDALRAELQKRK